jgi:cell division protein FtsZ
VLGGSTTLLDAFKRGNEVLQGAVQGIAELITRPGSSTSTSPTCAP